MLLCRFSQDEWWAPLSPLGIGYSSGNLSEFMAVSRTHPLGEQLLSRASGPLGCSVNGSPGGGFESGLGAGGSSRNSQARGIQGHDQSRGRAARVRNDGENQANSTEFMTSAVSSRFLHSFLITSF